MFLRCYFPFLFVLSFLFQTSSSLRCYSCSKSDTDDDDTCVNHVEDTTIIECSMKYCWTLRQDYQDPINKVASITRTCLDDPPDPKNGIVENTVTYRFYYTTCSEDLCNGGNGKRSTGSKNNALGDKSLIIAPGKENSAAKTNSIISLVVGAYIIRMLI